MVLRALRLCVAQPWAVAWLALLLAALAGAKQWRTPLALGLVVAWAAAAQGLRVTWRNSRGKALAIAGVLLVAGALVANDPSNEARWSGLTLLALPAAAVVVELALRRLRAARGALWLDAPPAPVADAPPAPAAGAAPPSFWRRNRSGCLGALALALGVCAWSVYRISLPGRHAAETRAELHAGQSAREVLAAARGGFTSTIVVRSGDGGETLYRVVTWDGERYSVGEGPGSALGAALSRDEMLAWLDARAEALARVSRVHFSFQALGVPPRVAFVVSFDEHGRLREISASRTWD